MAIAKSQRFEHRDLMMLLESDEFPPESLIYSGILMTLMGESNKQDLVPTIEATEVRRAVTFGIGMKQLIYSDQDGTLYDACIYKDEKDKVFVYAVRTRQMPERKRK